MLVAAALIQIYLAVWIAALALALLTCAALIVLRYLIHVGLMEEAAEIPIGPDIACPNCGEQTPRHTFCGNCGIALQALPKARQT